MEKERLIKIEVEKTLNSFENDNILEENPFLYTRILNEIENKKKRRNGLFELKVYLKPIIILIVLLINLITMVYFFNRDTKLNVQQNLVKELKADFDIEQNQNIF